MKKRMLVFVCCFIATMVSAQSYMMDGRTHLAPLPLPTPGNLLPVTSLNGMWEINTNAGKTFQFDTTAGDSWKPIQVPGEAMMQGFTIHNDVPLVYRKKMRFAKAVADQKQLLRFNGVYSHARVYFNGQFVREHFGGFTTWDCDITSLVKPGQDNWLHVMVTDRADDISYASGYAHHPIGGILRNVQHIILPATHIQRLYAGATLENNYQSGKLKIDLSLNRQAGNNKIEWSLVAPSGKIVSTRNIATDENGNAEDEISLADVKRWTAETPHLYKLKVTLRQNGKLKQTIEQSLGFRKVEIGAKNNLLVNGSTVKLRGACRHDMHPLLGRSTNRQQDSLDVVLAKEANLNFIRTSHYPPSKDFLEFCDRYGIYVQEETAICFVLDWREGVYKQFGETQNDTAFTGRYLGQLSEMIDRDRNHASVIMWSIGNESNYGTNFQKEYEFVKSVDLSRPVSWSWPNTALKAGKRCFDIAVSHYPVYNGKGSDMGGIEKNMMHPDFPVIGDEWAHVACYNTDMLTYDPNAKDFWGRSLDTMWLARFDVAGNIGGAIWGMIDETFHLPDTVTGYGPWGFIDVWRRKKAEFWNTKKAYSPIRVMHANGEDKKNGWLEVPVRNRYDHLNLNQVKAVVMVNGKSLPLQLPSVAPHESGV
ncbi:MAG: glycoside hydrolase family 2 TIM barrel-domain containing protein, partial [Agriterribacter sp.]